MRSIDQTGQQLGLAEPFYSLASRGLPVDYVVDLGVDGVEQMVVCLLADADSLDCRRSRAESSRAA
jgi:hypothetical protein